jgi:hypothetical protein
VGGSVHGRGVRACIGYRARGLGGKESCHGKKGA